MSRSVCRQGSVPPPRPSLRHIHSCSLRSPGQGRMHDDRDYYGHRHAPSRPWAPLALRYGLARCLCRDCAKGGGCDHRRYARSWRHGYSPLYRTHPTHDRRKIIRQRQRRLLPKLQQDASFPRTSRNGPVTRWSRIVRDRPARRDNPWPMGTGPIGDVGYAWTMAERDGLAARRCA
jgi:hypothetical protein